MKDVNRLHYYAVHPDEVPLTPALSKGLPMSADDFESGEVGRVLADLCAQEGFIALEPQVVANVLARGFGYASWDALTSQKAEAIATVDDLPVSEVLLLDVIAWRMYLTGQVGLREAVTAVHAAWKANLLSLRLVYGDHGQIERERDVADIERRAQIPLGEWRAWPDVALDHDGKLRLKWAAEMAYCAASYCWSAESGVTLAQLAAEIERGSKLSIEDAIDQSWMYDDPWPPGLRPTEYQDADGQLVGYGWSWPELGLYRAKVFGSTQAFKKSAIALWLRQPTDHVARRELPTQLIEVAFSNPWDTRDFSRSQSANHKFEIEFERRNRDQSPWMEVRPTDGSSLCLGRSVVLDGETWTGTDKRNEAADVDGVLSLQLPTMEEVKAAGQEIEWMLSKVPYGLDVASYELLCRVQMAREELVEQESQWLAAGQDSKRELSELLRQSSRRAALSVSMQSATAMEEPLGTVKHLDVPEAGHEMTEVYPEMACMNPEQMGEYALAYYGKDGIRRDRSHSKRDQTFMAYAVVRNLGVDASADHSGDFLAIHRLVRQQATKDLWNDANARAKMATAAMKVNAALRWATDLLLELDSTLSAPSRLEMILGQRHPSS